MKKVFIVFVISLGAALALLTLSCSSKPDSAKVNHEHAAGNNAPVAQQAARVPAHYENAESARPLKATLDPEQFFGNARRAYQVAREIPETLAQLPCYCYCDQGFGHKSLHSCYESDHSAHCAVCVDEALMAYQLQKEQNLSPVQIREKIIARFAH